jgi:hypothetical protein
MNHTAARFASRWEIPEECALQVRDELLIGLRHEWCQELGIKELGAACWSPITLGLLLLRTTGTDMTPLPEEVQACIRSNSPQHRIELRGSNEALPRGVVCFDGRCMYLGCCDDIGLASGRFRRQASFTGADRGKAHIEFTVPSGWSGVGILPVKRGDGASWHFPEVNPEIGTWNTWADLQEVRMAQKAGWKVNVQECLVWEAGGPLNEWSRRLQRLYRIWVNPAHANHNDHVARCIRSIALLTIGAMHTPWRKETVEVLDDSPLVTLDSVQSVGSDSVTVERWTEKNRPADEFHPEWTTAIWARARCRVLRALLSLPAEAILGVRGDAIYIDGRVALVAHNLFPDDGACGRLRLAWADFNPRPRVRSWADLNPPELARG